MTLKKSSLSGGRGAARIRSRSFFVDQDCPWKSIKGHSLSQEYYSPIQKPAQEIGFSARIPVHLSAPIGKRLVLAPPGGVEVQSMIPGMSSRDSFPCVCEEQDCG